MSDTVVSLALLSAIVWCACAVGCPRSPSMRYEQRTFFGYACDDDCERQKAGFAWAERNSVAHGAACETLASGAREGCRAFVAERLTPESAGYRWALENEIAAPCLCEGAGERFRVGCRRQLGPRGAD